MSIRKANACENLNQNLQYNHRPTIVYVLSIYSIQKLIPSPESHVVLSYLLGSRWLAALL